MALGTALVQPQVLTRPEPDTEAALIEDVIRLAALFVEDAAAGGVMAEAAAEAAADTGARLEATFTPRLAAAQARLRSLVKEPRAYVDRLVADAETAGDAAAVVALLRGCLGDLARFVDGLTSSTIRTVIGSAKALLETDLGLRPRVLADLTLEFIDALIVRLRQLVPDGPALGRRRRVAAAVLARLRTRLATVTPPEIDVEALAQTIDRWLRGTGLTSALREMSCALDALQAAFTAAEAAGTTVRSIGRPEHHSGLLEPRDWATYSWYASWVLNDEDMPLIGLSEVTQPRKFVEEIQEASNPLKRFLREQFSEPERQVLDSYTDRSVDPDRQVLTTVLGVVNRTMQRQPILETAQGTTRLDEDKLTDDIRNLRRNYRADQDLLMYNRRVLEHAFPKVLDTEHGGFVRWLERLFFAGAIGCNGFTSLTAQPIRIGWPRNQVYVTGDRRLVMCGDKPIHVGDKLHWYDAPIFAEANPGQFHFRFQHVSAKSCEVLAQVLHAAADTGKGVWHVVDLQPGHAVGGGSVAAVEFADVVQQVLLGRPISGYFMEGGPPLRAVGTWLDSALGLKGMITLFSSLQGVVGRDDGELGKYWLTVFLGDALRTAGPVQTVNTLRDLVLSFVTLLNFGGPQDAPSVLPSNPAANHRKQAPLVSLSDTLFAMLLTSRYPRDSYSRNIWDKDGIGDRRLEAMLGYWFGGSLGLGLAAGLSGSLVAQVIAWAEDVKRFFLTGAVSAAKMFVLFWLYNYLFKENDTDGGRYRPGGGSFRGYPPKDSSPYRLPVPGGEEIYVGQANLGLFSHNFITNSNFLTPANGAPQQAYAYDFGHEFHQGVACVRSGVVHWFKEGLDNHSTGEWNSLVVRHATIDPVHDDFGAGPVQTYSVYGHLAKDGVTNAPAFGGIAPTPTVTPVNRGELIALADDTGTSFHNHLHLHVVPDDGTGQPDLNAPSRTIPFVFGDVPGDGVPTSTTWYRSGNA